MVIFLYNPGLILTQEAPLGINTRITAKGFTGIHVDSLKSCHLI